MLPDESRAIPTGTLKRAAEPVPLVLPGTRGWPAIVVTTPPGVTFRIVSLLASAT